MATKSEWRDTYLTAVQETDWTRMPERIKNAESEIGKRQMLLMTDQGVTSAERREIANALAALNILREEVAAWQRHTPQLKNRRSSDPAGNSST